VSEDHLLRILDRELEARGDELVRRAWKELRQEAARSDWQTVLEKVWQERNDYDEAHPNEVVASPARELITAKIYLLRIKWDAAPSDHIYHWFQLTSS
jgi:hypothetical protein